MLGCAWSRGNSELGSECQQHSNNRSSILWFGSWFICYIHELWKQSGRELQEYTVSLLIVCSIQINSSIAFFLLDKSNMVNDVPESNNDDFVCLNLVSSRHCGLCSAHSSPYPLQVSPWTKLLFSDLCNLVGRHLRLLIRILMRYGADHQYPIVSVTLQ
jgi:hypothetical protein